nr:Veg family protein [Clostridioides difficile]
MATVQTLDKIRVSLERHIGKKILLKANKGRKQIITKEGILEKVYPSVFVIKLDDEVMDILEYLIVTQIY